MFRVILEDAPFGWHYAATLLVGLIRAAEDCYFVRRGFYCRPCGRRSLLLNTTARIEAPVNKFRGGSFCPEENDDPAHHRCRWRKRRLFSGHFLEDEAPRPAGQCCPVQ